MFKRKWLGLQFFAGEGAPSASGAGTGDGAASGVNAVTPGQQRLLELGVPADKIRKRAYKSASAPNTSAESATASEAKTERTDKQAAAAENTTPTETKTDGEAAKISWDEFMADPENNKRMQSIVQSRLRSAKNAEESLNKLTPAVEVLARKYKLDPENMDYDALAKAISDDDSYYEDKALEMGVSVETAKKIDQKERNEAREKVQNARTLQEERITQHFQNLEQQAEGMKKVFPNFDLRKELQNPVFARMTHPNVGISVEDAYHAVHRKEIQSVAMQVTAEKTAEKISNAIQAGSRRPDESGTSSQGPSVSTFNYRAASKEQREAFKKSLRDKWARGEKVYPGQN